MAPRPPLTPRRESAVGCGVWCLRVDPYWAVHFLLLLLLVLLLLLLCFFFFFYAASLHAMASMVPLQHQNLPCAQADFQMHHALIR